MIKIYRIVIFIVLIFSVCYCSFIVYKYIKNIDVLSPVIEMDSPEIIVSINDPVTQAMSGVIAKDSKDGDVTNDMIIKNVSNFNEEKERVVDYIAFDKDGNYSEAQRTLKYSDYNSPKFEIKNALKFPIGVTEEDILENISVWDCLDGDISDKVTFSKDSFINSNIAGKYKVELDITNSAGDLQQLPITVDIDKSIYSNTSPEINLKKYLVYTKVGEKLNLLDYVQDVKYHGTTYVLTDEEGTFAVDTSNFKSYEKELFKEREPSVNKDKINVISYINYQIPGVYEVIYELRDLEDNVGNVILTVVVEDDE